MVDQLAARFNRCDFAYGYDLPAERRIIESGDISLEQPILHRIQSTHAMAWNSRQKAE